MPPHRTRDPFLDDEASGSGRAGVSAEPFTERDERGSSGGDAARAARVLVVEDNVDAALTLVDLLRIWGHEVRCVHDGPAAVEIAPGYRPEVVLLDIGLPGMDGYEVARRLRGAPETREALLVAVTGYGQESDRARSREAGFDHHLVKPVDLDGLRRLIGSG